MHHTLNENCCISFHEFTLDVSDKLARIVVFLHAAPTPTHFSVVTDFMVVGRKGDWWIPETYHDQVPSELHSGILQAIGDVWSGLEKEVLR